MTAVFTVARAEWCAWLRSRLALGAGVVFGLKAVQGLRGNPARPPASRAEVSEPDPRIRRAPPGYRPSAEPREPVA